MHTALRSTPWFFISCRDWDVVITVTECKLHGHLFSNAIYVARCMLEKYAQSA